MRFGLVASILLHLCAVGLLFVSLPASWRTKVETEPYVPIELISQAELAKKTSVPAVAPEPKEAEKPPEEEPAPAVNPEPPKPKAEEPKPEPPPAPKPEEMKPEPKPEVKKPEPPKVAPKPKPKKETGDLDLDQLSALVDKAKKKEEPQGAPPLTSNVGEKPQQQVGAGDKLTASDEAKMKAAIKPCWHSASIIGAPDASKLIVILDIDLNRDGTLAGPPRVVNQLQISLSGNKFWAVAEQEALRAVSACAPYDFLSQDRYDVWREMQLTFDPSEMAGY
ncbi:MAG TPA: hypothetical protein VNH64_07220 [Parvularculaceae bacterium]|nr:hypothetical protein [Parvularculaceae bacterium]